MTGRSQNDVYAVVSLGLWRLREDIATILGGRIVFWPLHPPKGITAFVGWGGRPSGLRARTLGARHDRPVVIVEDGFVKSYQPGPEEPAHSFVVDRKGVYFDIARPNDLAGLMNEPCVDPNELARSASLIDLIRANRLSKYNNSPLLSTAAAGIPGGRQFVLLVEQIPGDASIAGALASLDSFSAMLIHAREHNPDKQLVVRAHPAAGDGSILRRAAEKLGIEITVPGRMNPWPLLEEADSVYTVSSQLGFEALMARRPVHCFGTAWYAGRGLTVDYGKQQALQPMSLEQVFHAAYLQYARYLDIHDRSPCRAERAIEQAIIIRDQRNRLPRKIYAVGLSPWKRLALDPFLKGMHGRAVHMRTMGAAENAARRKDGCVAVWGSERVLPADVPAIRIEDGFIRSRGLGADLVMPSSIAIDGGHVYYDARGESALEHMIATMTFDAGLLARAGALVDEIVRRGVSKYNLPAMPEMPDVAPGILKILVPGQVEKDASIRFGSPEVKTNADLLARVRVLYPDAYIVYKEHPDVAAGLRSGGAQPQGANFVARSGDILHWIEWCDRVETMTSLTGFEALLRCKHVGVHGIPFYAGWGLTDDRVSVPRRRRRASLEMLAAAALILYPSYIHPVSRMPCSPEDLVQEFGLPWAKDFGIVRRSILMVSRVVNRCAVRIRDMRV
ncbi:capsular polysaccharide biosynthesis protein [Rhizobiaceae bacterium n13]|uniref:capsular polysaccharide biosynthesis protein n=1 Tax=Ferirhizobium litorale TaxID=2927786 RepID=UPI0024B2B937|nr:capsular polysaccharide biosynthesis protein [Fererhizobium litorale]MDI7860645.1 capsular polysaccharide biosynthesis protein [Fererhizobium litorale]